MKTFAFSVFLIACILNYSIFSFLLFLLGVWSDVCRFFTSQCRTGYCVKM